MQRCATCDTPLRPTQRHAQPVQHRCRPVRRGSKHARRHPRFTRDRPGLRVDLHGLRHSSRPARPRPVLCAAPLLTSTAPCMAPRSSIHGLDGTMHDSHETVPHGPPLPVRVVLFLARAASLPASQSASPLVTVRGVHGTVSARRVLFVVGAGRPAGPGWCPPGGCAWVWVSRATGPRTGRGSRPNRCRRPSASRPWTGPGSDRPRTGPGR